MNKLFKLCLLLMVLPVFSYAECEYFTAADVENFVLTELSGVLYMQVDRGVGETIYRSSPAYFKNDKVSCIAATTLVAQSPHGMSPISDEVFRLKLGSRTDVLGFRVLLDGQAIKSGDNEMFFLGYPEGDVIVEFIKLSDDLNALIAGETPAVLSGKILDLEALRCVEGDSLDRRGQCDHYDTPEQLAQFHLGAGQLTIKPATCSVEVNPIVVQLPLVYTSSFGSVGSVAGQTAFDMDINCSVEGINFSITLDSTHKLGEFTGVMKSVKPGTARNVGVQMLSSNEQPVVFGQPISLGKTENIVTVQFYAQYIQTAAIVMPGSLITSATYTFTYD